MKSFTSSNTFKLLCCFACVLIAYNIQAQTVHLIPNPADYTTYPGSPNEDFPVNYDGNLIFGIYSGQFVAQLAKYDGNTVTAIVNPPFCQLNLYHDAIYPQTIIFNNKLYFTVVKNDNEYELAQYDNDSITLINPPKGYTYHPEGSFTVYKGKLYMEYANDSTLQYQLAAFDGDGVSIIPNPGQIGNIVSAAPFVVYKDKLYFYYSTHGQYEYPQLASYDGTNITAIPNPPGIDIAAGNLIVYHDNLYFQGDSLFRGSNLMKYDGTSIEVLQNPGNGSIGDLSASNSYYFPWTPFIDSVHNQLCFQYSDYDSYKVHLASYNDTSITVIPNPTSTGIGQSYPMIFPIQFNNKMYILYQSNLAEYTGDSLSIIPNPTSRSQISQEPLIVFGKSLYYQLNTINMGKFDGMSTSIVSNTKGYEDYPIIYNNEFFGYYYDSTKKVNGLGYLDTSSVLAVDVLTLTAQLQNKNGVLHWQTGDKDNTSFFNVQRSFDGINFITIEKMPVSNNNQFAVKDYIYADNNVNLLGKANLFYRLQIVDKNGINTYSDIVTIHLLEAKPLFSVSPNPAKDFIKIIASRNISNASIRITDLEGKTLYFAKSNFAQGQLLNVATSQFPAEVLFITLSTENYSEQFKIVKE